VNSEGRNPKAERRPKSEGLAGQLCTPVSSGGEPDRQRLQFTNHEYTKYTNPILFRVVRVFRGMNCGAQVAQQNRVTAILKPS